MATVTQQPTSNQVQPAPQNVREWSSGLCACCKDCGMCMFACCCYPCFLCGVAGKMNECILGPFCFGAPFNIAMRTKFRTMYGINGSVCKDICAVACCDFCAMTQLMRELNFYGHGF